MKEKYLQKLFQAYYRNHHSAFEEISDLPHRELAFLYWNRPGMSRHLSFPNVRLLTKYVIQSPPRHAYHSATYYENPAAGKMDQKGFLGCDLVFDIDSDHIPTPCRLEHNYVICKKCQEVIMGEKPEQCPACGHTKFTKIVWICDECLNVSKQQVFHLLDHFLFKEFAISEDDVKIFFSGHRGYHVHISSPQFRALDQDARREVADYLTGTGFSFRGWNYEAVQNNWHGFHMNQFGWPGKIARQFYEILDQGETAIEHSFKFPRYGKPLSSQVIGRLIDERKFLLDKLLHYDTSWGISKIGKNSWIRLFEILRDHIKADIDVVVSIDLHRLIRLNGSLHGKTGFKVMPVEYEDLKEFDPLQEALSFPQNQDNQLPVQISVPKVPSFRIGDTIYGSYIKGEKIKLPLNAALFLLCKDVAELVSK